MKMADVSANVLFCCLHITLLSDIKFRQELYECILVQLRVILVFFAKLLF